MFYKVKKSEFVFFVMYMVYLFTLNAGHTVFEEDDICALIFKGLRYACYAVAAGKIINDGYRKKQIFSLILLGIFVVLTVYCSGNKTFAFYFLVLAAAKDINIRDIVKITCVMQGIFLAVIIPLSQMGIISDYIYDANTRARHCLGFTWATTAPILYFFFVMAYIYLRKERIRTLELLLLELVNIYLYVKTDARMSFYLSSLMLLYFLVMRFYWQNRADKIRKNRVLTAFPAAMCVFALILHICCDVRNEKWNQLNILLSNRLMLGHDAWETYGLTLFGSRIKWIGYSHNSEVGVYNYVDSSYMQILLENGIVSLLIIVALYMYIMYMAIKIKDFYLQTAIIFITAFSITEPRLMNLSYNPFPFFAVAAWAVSEKEQLFCRVRSAGIRLQALWPRVRLKKRC